MAQRALTEASIAAVTELSDIIDKFTLKRSDDGVKTDLELTCGFCGEHICDAEHGDTLLVLVETALRHRRAECKG